MHFWSTAGLLACLGAHSWAALDLGFDDDSDLSSFVTRPDIKAPLFNVTHHDPANISPGYWFVAAYASVSQPVFPLNHYQPCQSGPLIYDGNGELIWSGACLVENRITFDFRPWRFNDTFYLSALHIRSFTQQWPGHGFIMDNSYNITTTLYPPPQIKAMDRHEFQLVDDGRTALHVMSQPAFVNVSELQLGDQSKRVRQNGVQDNGFRAVDLATGKTLFTWWALSGGHVRVQESDSDVEHPGDPSDAPWDCFHANAVDKNGDGDYLFSIRHTNSILKISGQDGRILWQLGGIESSFALDGFNFSRQHDARFFGRNGDKELISFLDNASDEYGYSSSSQSSALVIEVDPSATPPTARVAHRIPRPDGNLTHLRGNYQILPNGHSFVGWSDNAYLTEHDTDGRLLMEAAFRSDRFHTYRAYKSEFTARPTEPPAIKAFAFGTTVAKATTVVYISWNGATEVATWRFYTSRQGKTVAIGEKKRTGFETVFQGDGYYREVFAEALAADGSSLGTSPMEAVSTPDDWPVTSGPQEDSISDHDGIEDPSEHRLARLLSGVSTEQSGYIMIGASILSLSAVYTVARLFMRGPKLSRLLRAFYG